MSVPHDWTFPAEVLRVVDGDTVDVLLDVGFDIHIKERLRLEGINAPEMRGDEREAGKRAKVWLEELIHNNSPILVETQQEKGKFGRYVATLYGTAGDGIIDLNRRLVEDGHAVFKEY